VGEYSYFTLGKPAGKGNLMDIEVSLFATLQEGRFRRKRLVLPEGSTVADVCRHLGFDDREAAIVLVNSSPVEHGHRLSSGDAVSLLPALGGG
jgi:sulfur carrier protein ThiS